MPVSDDSEPRASARADISPRVRPRSPVGPSSKVLAAFLAAIVFVPLPAVAQRPEASVRSGDVVTEREKQDREKLSEKLARKALAASDEDLMTEIIRLMNECTRKLEIEFDSSGSTQAIQNRIMDQINKAIRQAAAQRRRSRSDQPGPQSDRRRRPSDPTPGEQQGSRGRAEGGTDTDVSSADSGASSAPTKLPSGALRESRRGWGNLPTRDRDEIIQGSGEKFIERYRKMIEEYYKALQESDEEP